MDLDELERLRAVAEQQLGSRELGSTYLYETDVDTYMTALRNCAEELIRDARACAEIRRMIALGKDDGSVGRVARRAVAQEGKG
jgi:hypothetical protein